MTAAPARRAMPQRDLPTDPAPPPPVRLRQHLRQDDPRLAARLHHRRRHARRPGARHGCRHRDHLPDRRSRGSRSAPSSAASRLDAERLFGNTDLMGAKVGTLGGYVTYKYGIDLRPRCGGVVDPGPVGDARRRGPPWKPRLRRRCALRQAPHRASRSWPRIWSCSGWRCSSSTLALTFSSNAFGDAALGDAIPLDSALRIRRSGSAPWRCSSVAWRSCSRRCSAAPARPASPGSRWRRRGSSTASTSAARCSR